MSDDNNQDNETSNCKVDGFSFNSTAAELMAKFSDNEFLPDSRISSQFSADELSCRQNFNAIPVTDVNQKERMELSCFSGIMGDLDLSVESCAGRKVSVGEFFERKCGALGRISNGGWTERPSFGLMEITSPKRNANAAPLINETAATVESSSTSIIDSTINDECDIMSLSKIAQALQSVDGTPGRLVDQLLMVNKKQKTEPTRTMNLTGNTYTLMSVDRTQQQPLKLSFDSERINDSVGNDKSIGEIISFEGKNGTIRNSMEATLQQFVVDEKKDNTKMQIKLSTSDRTIKQEQNSISLASCLNGKIFIGKNIQELYKCIIGVSRDADIEIRNESDRWLNCMVKLLQIQGDKNNVEINVPANEFLVGPNKLQIVKIGVKLEKMGDPIMAALAIDITDMTTREVFTKQHMMCFIPEETKKIDNYPGNNRAKIDTINEENDKDLLRCNTPQQLMFIGLGDCSCPTSPQSRTSSVKSGDHSPRSITSSAGTVAGDIIPIKSTHSSLVWTSVRVGKYETREFTIRNTSNNRIKLQGLITDNDNSFKFLKDRETSTTITIVLQHMESKTFTVIFTPNTVGAAAGKITFMHHEKKRDNESRPSRIIPLYGYGGYAKVCISQALKIMGDQMWLSLGKLNANGTLNTRIKLENTGDLPAYAKISLAPKAVYPSVENNWLVQPTELILGPKVVQWVTLEFRPRKQDIVLIRGDIADMGTLIITHGDEPTRWRIRRLYKKMREAGGQSKKNEQQDIFRNVVYPICKIFPGEMPMSNNLNIIRDSVQDLEILCRQVNRHVITLTMELSGDDSISIFRDDDDDANESQMFQSLYSDITAVLVTNENSYMPTETITGSNAEITDGHTYLDQFTALPKVITLTPPSDNDKSIIITSLSNTAQPFEITVTNPEYLSVIPSEGMIPAQGGVRIKVQCKKRIAKSVDAVVQIYTANEKQDIIIKIRPG